jgi:hypothetical protein
MDVSHLWSQPKNWWDVFCWEKSGISQIVGRSLWFIRNDAAAFAKCEIVSVLGYSDSNWACMCLVCVQNPSTQEYSLFLVFTKCYTYSILWFPFGELWPKLEKGDIIGVSANGASAMYAVKKGFRVQISPLPCKPLLREQQSRVRP